MFDFVCGDFSASIHAPQCSAFNAVCGAFLCSHQVASMKGVAEEKKVVVAQAKTDCEELLVEIVQVSEWVRCCDCAGE